MPRDISWGDVCVIRIFGIGPVGPSVGKPLAAAGVGKHG